MKTDQLKEVKNRLSIFEASLRGGNIFNYHEEYTIRDNVEYLLRETELNILELTDRILVTNYINTIIGSLYILIAKCEIQIKTYENEHVSDFGDDDPFSTNGKSKKSTKKKKVPYLEDYEFQMVSSEMSYYYSLINLVWSKCQIFGLDYNNMLSLAIGEYYAGTIKTGAKKEYQLNKTEVAVKEKLPNNEINQMENSEFLNTFKPAKVARAWERFIESKESTELWEEEKFLFFLENEDAILNYSLDFDGDKIRLFKDGGNPEKKNIYKQKLVQLRKIYESRFKANEPTNQKPKKLKWLGKPSQFGFIMNLLAESGFIEIPKTNGEPSYTKFAEFCMFNFDLDTTPKNLAKEINPGKNTLGETNRKKFKIPNITDL